MRVNQIRPAIAVSAASAVLMMAAPAFAEMVTFKADMKGSFEVPANDSKGTGTVEATFDTSSKKLSWTVTYTGLTGAATAAHFHGPAAVAANAPPVVPLSGSLMSPIKGDATLTDVQASALLGGQMYLNIHTAAHKDGELRGQIVKK